MSDYEVLTLLWAVFNVFWPLLLCVGRLGIHGMILIAMADWVWTHYPRRVVATYVVISLGLYAVGPSVIRWLVLANGV